MLSLIFVGIIALIGYIGLATPNFLLALVMLYFANVWFGTSIGGR